MSDAETFPPIGLSGIQHQVEPGIVWVAANQIDQPLDWKAQPSALVPVEKPYLLVEQRDVERLINAVPQRIPAQTPNGERLMLKWLVGFRNDAGEELNAYFTGDDLFYGREPVKASDGQKYYGRAFELPDGKLVIGVLPEGSPEPDDVQQWLREIFLPSQGL